MSSVNPRSESPESAAPAEPESRAKSAWWQKLNRALFPFMGPAQLGPFDQEPLPSTAQKPCPLCGQPMELHTFVRSQDRSSTRMTCP